MQKNIVRTAIVALTLGALITSTQTAHAGWKWPWKDTGQGQQSMYAPAPIANRDGNADRGLPSLVLSDTPAQNEVLYTPGTRDTAPITSQHVSVQSPSSVTTYAPTSIATSTAPNYYAPAPIAQADDGRWGSGHIQTLVSRKVVELNTELSSQKTAISSFQQRLSGLQGRSDAQAADYYTLVAHINTELQSGTTAGNPILTERWHTAQNMLDGLSQSTGSLNDLAGDVANEASKASYFQESVRATYGLSGAIAEDHKKLQWLEDGINQDMVALNRLLTSVNDEINRRTSYLRAEQLNMQTLSLAISNGELYGRNMSNSLFKKIAESDKTVFAQATTPARRRPLVVIRFDRPNVQYRQAVYTAVSQALEKYPAAMFDLIAVNPSEGNPAHVALASTEARKNGEGVLRSLTQMGLPMERIRLNAAASRDVRSSEVHIYIQ